MDMNENIHIEEYNAHECRYHIFIITIKKLKPKSQIYKGLFISDWCIIVCHF